MTDRPRRRREIIRLTRADEKRLAVMAARRQSHWTRRLALRLSRWLNNWSARP